MAPNQPSASAFFASDCSELWYEAFAIAIVRWLRGWWKTWKGGQSRHARNIFENKQAARNKVSLFTFKRYRRKWRFLSKMKRFIHSVLLHHILDFGIRRNIRPHSTFRRLLCSVQPHGLPLDTRHHTHGVVPCSKGAFHEQLPNASCLSGN